MFGVVSQMTPFMGDRLSLEDATIGRSFWALGLAFLLPGFLMRQVGALRPAY